MNDDLLLAKYLVAAGIERIPKDLSASRFVEKHQSPEQRRDYLERNTILTKIWNCADTDTGRLAGLKAYMEGPNPRDDIAKIINSFIGSRHNRLPKTEIEFALDQLGLTNDVNGVLSDEEKNSLDRDGFVNLGKLLSDADLQIMRTRYDDEIVRYGRGSVQDVKPGIARIEDTVVKSINHDGLFDPIFMHPRLLAAVRHVLGIHLKYIGSNYHCPMPGYGHQDIHADYMWGVEGAPEVVNAVWMIDDFTRDNGSTRLVPGSHRFGITPGMKLDNPSEPVNSEIKITGPAGSCLVYNAHLWHGGTQNCSRSLRRAQHAFFSHAHRPSSTNVPKAIHEKVYRRLGRVERAILDIE